MTDQYNNYQKRNNTGADCGCNEREVNPNCGCCEEKKDNCNEKCISECEYGQLTMQFYSYIQAVQDSCIDSGTAEAGEPKRVRADATTDDTRRVRADATTDDTRRVRAADLDANTSVKLSDVWTASYDPSYDYINKKKWEEEATLWPSFHMATYVSSTEAILGSGVMSSQFDPFSGTVSSGEDGYTVTFRNLPKGLQYVGFTATDSLKSSQDTQKHGVMITINKLAAGLDKRVVKQYLDQYSFKPLLPNTPCIEPVDYLSVKNILTIAEYIISKINELCLPEIAKINIIDKLVFILQNMGTHHSLFSTLNVYDDSYNFSDDHSDDLFYGSKNKKNSQNFSFCQISKIPECGPIFIAADPIIFKFLSYAKFLLRSYFVNSCDCDLTFEHACRFVFGRFCFVDVYENYRGKGRGLESQNQSEFAESEVRTRSRADAAESEVRTRSRADAESFANARMQSRAGGH